MVDSASRDRPSRTLRARVSPTPSTAWRSSMLAASSFCRPPKWSTSRSTTVPGQARHLGQQPVAARADGGVERLAAGVAERAGDRGEVEQVEGVERVEVGEHVGERARPAAGRRRQVVADDQLAVAARRRRSARRAAGRAAGRRCRARRRSPRSRRRSGAPSPGAARRPTTSRTVTRSSISSADSVPDDLVEAQLVALEGGQRLVGAGQDLARTSSRTYRWPST